MEILDNKQKQVLELLSQSKLKRRFYWTGGTLLAYTLKHRKSVDLDFFSEKPFTFDQVSNFVQEVKNIIRFENITSNKIFDRWEFFLSSKDEELRIEFVHFNDDKKTLRPRKVILGVLADSLDDIAANKTMAHFDRTEPKDLFDLYFLIKQKKYTAKRLLRLVTRKFGVKFSESSFWSESFKTLPLLHSIKPLVVAKDQNQKEQLLAKVETYFRQSSRRLLKTQLG